MNSPDVPSDPHASFYAAHSPHPYPSSTSAAATAAAALSQQHLPSPPDAAGSTNGRKRKATAVPGSRGVANLTPEQLAKKRANDREAQRAIRERTKHTIESLEQRIRELESQQPFQELQRVAQERDRALAECEQLRNKLAVVQNVVGGIQPSSSTSSSSTSTSTQQQAQQPNLHELANLTAQQSPLPPLHSPHPPQFPHGMGFEQQHLHPELRSPRSSSLSSPANHSMSTAPSTYPLESSSLRMERVSTPPYGTPTGATYEPRLPPPAAMLDGNNGERLDLNYVLEPKQHPTPTSEPTQLSSQYTPSPGRDTPLYAHIPQYLPPTCPLDSLLIDFVASRRRQVASGVPMRDVIGPDNPTFDGLRDPSALAHANAHPISAILIEILYKFPGISELPDKVAVHYVMFLNLRWLICPCATCYERMPEWFRPSPSHLDVPKPAWTDHVPWPSMRFQIVAGGGDVKLEDFFIPFTAKLRVNWPYAPDDVLIPAERRDEGSKMNPAFESHLRVLSNWSVGNVFVKAFPHLVDQSVRVVG